MKYLVYILFAVIGFCISYWIFYNGGEANYVSVISGFWTGYIGHMILNMED